MKYDLAQYLVNLETLMAATDAAGQGRPLWLAEEYNRTWDQLKKEVKDETRNRK